MKQLFLDLDGVLSDFDGYYESQFGVRPNQDTYEPAGFWNNVRNHKSFYRDQPPMADAFELWNAVVHLNPIILSGVPYSIPNVAAQKRSWVNRYLGENVPLVCCASRDKRHYGKRGDILVDDRLKYAHHWTDMGGIFIHHTSAAATLTALAEHGFDGPSSPVQRRDGAG